MLEHAQHESAFLSSLFISSSVSNSSGVTLCNSISQLSIHSPSFLVMRDASSRLIDYLKMEKDPDIKMPRRSTTTKKSETGTRRKVQQKTLEELESRIIYYHKDTFEDKENYMGPPPPWIAYWDKEKLAKKLTQESSKQRPTGIVTLLVKQGGVDAKFAKNTTRAPTNLVKKRGAKELNKDNTMKEKKERKVKKNKVLGYDAIKPEWREIVQSVVQAFLEIEDCDIYTPSPIKKTQEHVRPSIPSFSLMIHKENKIGEEKKVIDEKNKIGEEEKVIEDNKLTEVDKDKIYFWATDDRLNKDETMCILKDISRVMLVREDIMSMLPRHQINNMLLVPCCYDYHWWLYAYDIYEKRLFVLDSLYKEAKGNRVQLDIYASKLIQQMVSIAVPNYELPKNDPIPIYLNLPRQSNNYDCGLFVIKWVEMWNPSSIEINVSNMPEWEEFECVNLRKQSVIQILTSPSNALLKDVINKSEKYRVVKPTPAQSSPYIVCNTDELMIQCLGSAGKGFRKKALVKKRKN
ncbi:hypothetical protein Ahy_B07g087728 [Arachis hypogaea]|uniref:Ubiquitin-like protease family profile domain-containing protein n=1 Tax=Arachis hypogaea TaxID=3818 RepID=A0A444YCV1_ARAHY|nr:hypothetical protein Ahy_B07g087728 [Arachis hypogaea]